jgi:hypothetical protein
MDQNKNLSNEPGKTSGTGTGSTGTTGASSTSNRTSGDRTSGGYSSGTGSSAGSSAGSGTGSSAGSSSPTSQTTGGQTGSSYTGQTTGSAPQRAREQDIGGQSTFDQTKQTVSDAYGKTTEVLTNTYDQAMSYGRENPGKLTLIAFGAGIAIGLLLSGTGGRSRTNRIAEPVVNALSQVAMEFFR